MKKVLVFGTFDIVHAGHIHMLKEAKEYGDYLVIVVSRDDITAQVKGALPIFNEHTRLQQVTDLGIGDRVRLGNLGEDRYKVIGEEQPDIIALGYDQEAFVDKLPEHTSAYTQIVRLHAYKPEIYKSSLIKAKMRESGQI